MLKNNSFNDSRKTIEEQKIYNKK